MLDRWERLAGRAAVLAAAGHHPYVRLNTTGDVTGYRSEDLLAWIGTDPRGPTVWALGDPATALACARELHGRSADAAATRMHLPRVPAAAGSAAFPVALQDDWDFLTATSPPPVTPAEDEVEQVPPGAGDDIGHLLDSAFPATTTRPGDQRVRRWYGIRNSGRLVAAGADRSRGGIGFLAGLAVHPEHRRRGLGAALTARMTRDLHAEFGVVTLGVMSDDAGARRMYERLGFTDALARSSLKINARLTAM
jgi:ribosomal protein S18 acetylase RimI-like enzyme